MKITDKHVRRAQEAYRDAAKRYNWDDLSWPGDGPMREILEATFESLPEWCGDYTYRYTAVRGLERRRVTSSTYHSVTGDILAAMTADELEHIAQVMKR